MGKMVNFMLSNFYHNKKNPEETVYLQGTDAGL